MGGCISIVICCQYRPLYIPDPLPPPPPPPLFSPASPDTKASANPTRDREGKYSDHSQLLLLRGFSVSCCEDCFCAIAMASTSSSTAVDERERKRKRATTRGDSTASAGPGTEAQPSKWRTRREHEIYSSKLFEALRLVRCGSSPSTAPARGLAVREAADRALAVAARGRSRWSRAILASRRRRLQAAHRARLRGPACPASRHPSAAVAAASPAGKAPALAKKAKVLGRLVPGCHKLPFPALLTEASDYIKALEMQVRAMTALAEVLASVSSSASGGSSSSPA
ncbi:unnamed protein product [Alopecurus aequalis]